MATILNFVLIFGMFHVAECERLLYEIDGNGKSGSYATIKATKTYSVQRNQPNLTHYEVTIYSQDIESFKTNGWNYMEARLAMHWLWQDDNGLFT